jgi:hypothetical protein
MSGKSKIDARLQMLDQEHVAPLTKLIRGLCARGLRVPNVDPLDGGINARALFLLESPGPKAVRSGFISHDNPDPSARIWVNHSTKRGLPARMWCSGTWFLIASLMKQETKTSPFVMFGKLFRIRKPSSANSRSSESSSSADSKRSGQFVISTSLRISKY